MAWQEHRLSLAFFSLLVAISSILGAKILDL